MNHMLQDKLKDEKFRGFFGLFAGRSILFISSGLLGIFVPIFLFNAFGGNFQILLLFYLISYLLYGLLVPFGAQFLNRFGFKKALIISTVWGALFYTTLSLIEQTAGDNTTLFITLIALSLVFQLLARIFYWLPYHIDFAKFTDKESRGEKVGLLFASLTLFGVVGPVGAGYIIEHYGFLVLFGIAIALFILAMFPFAIVPRTNEKFVWGYMETLRRVFDRENRSLSISLMASGAEDVVGIVVWPVFIYLLLQGNYMEVGAVSGFIVGATVALQIAAGKYIDKMTDKARMLKWGSVLYALGWVFKAFVITAFHVFVAGLYQNLTKILTRTSFDTIFYELVADKGHYVDEYTVLREVAIQLGRVLMLLAVIGLTLVFAIKWTFLLAAGAALLVNYLYVQHNEN